MAHMNNRASAPVGAAGPSRQMRNHTAILSAAVTVRNKKGISLEQIAEQTKLGVRMLRAIEEGNFSKLPGGIYNTSYIRQYAKAIDFDENELLAYYYAVMGISPPGSGTPGQDRTRDTALDSLGQPSTVAGS